MFLFSFQNLFILDLVDPKIFSRNGFDISFILVTFINVLSVTCTKYVLLSICFLEKSNYSWTLYDESQSLFKKKVWLSFVFITVSLHILRDCRQYTFQRVIQYLRWVKISHSFIYAICTIELHCFTDHFSDLWNIKNELKSLIQLWKYRTQYII